ncbi:MAG: ATP-binding protein [Bradymonadaceae bacterium]|nr:ATP-binding protein [Lujinxingiaceae bacterium]
MATKSTAAALYESELDYFQDELAWIETRCQRIAAGYDLDDTNENDTGAKRQRGGYYNMGDVEESTETPSELKQRSKRLVALEKKQRTAIDKRLKASRKANRPVALDRLCDLYSLDTFERNIMLLSTAMGFSKKFQELYAPLNMEIYPVMQVTIEVAFNFSELPFAERITRRKTFSSSGALIANDLVTLDIAIRYIAPNDLLRASLHVTNRTFGFLVGDDSLMDQFLDFSSVELPRASFENIVLDPSDKRRILSVVENHERYLTARADWGFDEVIQYGRGILMLFHGKPGTGKTMTAHAVAKHMEKRVLNVDMPTFAAHHEAERFLPGLFREARLQNAVLFFDECEVFFADRRMGNSLMTILLTEIERFEGVAILATNLPEALDPALDRRILVKIKFPEPDRVARHEIWKKHLPEKAPLNADVDLHLLADRYDMAGGYIKNAVLMAVADAVHGNNDNPTITMDHLERAAREQMLHPGEIDATLVHPKVRLDDVIMPARLREQISEFVRAARSQRTVLERWGIGAHLTYGRGVSALFYGEPGTGKTLCAESIAGELNLPLLIAAIPAIVSKWVGETERNLEHYFKMARTHSAVLFLDEADSLLMERGAGRASRHDDSVVNTLLTLIERHEGVVLLATNMVETLDKALSRRLTYRFAFPFPDAANRARIWAGLLPDTVPTDGPIDFAALGEGYALTGGYIKNAVFKAAFRAASADLKITQALLEQAAKEELVGMNTGQAKAIGFGAERTYEV